MSKAAWITALLVLLLGILIAVLGDTSKSQDPFEELLHGPLEPFSKRLNLSAKGALSFQPSAVGNQRAEC